MATARFEQISSEAGKAFEEFLTKLGALLQDGKDTEALVKDTGEATLAIERADIKAAGMEAALAQSHCFTAGTPVLTPTGEKLIEEFEVGDEILSRPEDSPDAPVRTSHVEKIFRLSGPTLELRVGGRLILTTAEHPFYVVGKAWTPAGHLKPRDMLLGDAGLPTAVESIKLTGRHETLYNLRVAFDRTYFVGSRPWGFSLWVHNTYTARFNIESGHWEVGVFDEEGNFQAKASILNAQTKEQAREVVNELNRVAEADPKYVMSQNQLYSAALDARTKVRPGELENFSVPSGVDRKAGHVGKHGYNINDPMLFEIRNNPDKIYIGINSNGNAVAIFWRDGDVLITDAADTKEVITAYGKSAPFGPKYKADVWQHDIAYHEVM